MAHEQWSNAAGPDTETSVQKSRPRQTNDADIGKRWAMLARERKRVLIRSDLLIITSGRQTRNTIELISPGWLFLPDFIPGTDQWIDYGLDMRADCESGGYQTLLLTSWCDSPLKWCLTLAIIHTLHHEDKMSLSEGVDFSLYTFLKVNFNTPGHVFNLREIWFCIALFKSK